MNSLVGSSSFSISILLFSTHQLVKKIVELRIPRAQSSHTSMQDWATSMCVCVCVWCGVLVLVYVRENGRHNSGIEVYSSHAVTR